MKANNNRTTRKNKVFSLPMQLDGYTARGEQYNPDDLIEILKTMKDYDISHLISIPVYSRKHLMYSNSTNTNKTSNIPIGYIMDIDIDNAKMNISIFDPFYSYVEQFTDPVISFRVILDWNDKYLRQIIAVDVTPSSECDYSGDYAAFLSNNKEEAATTEEDSADETTATE